MSTTRTRLIAAGLLASLATAACAESDHASPEILPAPSADAYRLEPVADDIDVPWGMVWLDDSRLLVTDQKGELRLIRDGELVAEPIGGVPEVDFARQGGLLDVEIDPNFADNGWLYLSYSGLEGEDEGSNTSIMRARLEGMRLVDQEVIFDAEPNTGSGHHFGSRIEFGGDGLLYFSIGDRGQRDVYPQRLDRDAGKVHRIHPDGRIPEDNPFVGQDGANASIYSYGHRNPQGMARHPSTGAIWTHEHGPRGGDEINIIRPGVNYGWPVITYGINYSGTKITDETHRDGMAQPDWYWVPSIAPSGVVFVTGGRYPEWRGHLLVGSLSFGQVVLVELDGDEVVGHSKLFEGIGRVRSLATHPNGEIYVGVDGKGVFRIVPAS
jgi:glucose/arabinose dehydrogenase